jgi:hypothetical protein
MTINFRCRHCGGESGEIPFPKTEEERLWFRTFMDIHNQCGPMAVTGMLTPVPDRAAKQEEQTPAPLRHEHQWEVETKTYEPEVFVQDCRCGARRRIKRDPWGPMEVLDADATVEGGSVANAVFIVHQGKPTMDRWAH